MTAPMIKIHDLSTDEVIEREMTAEEFAQYKIDVATANKNAELESAKIAAKNDLLAKLGLTEDEAKLLLS